MLNVFGGPLKKVLKTGNMLSVLNVLTVWGNLVKNNQTFNIFNTSPVLSICGKNI